MCLLLFPVRGAEKGREKEGTGSEGRRQERKSERQTVRKGLEEMMLGEANNPEISMALM